MKLFMKTSITIYAHPNDIGNILKMTDEIYDSTSDGCGGGFRNEILDSSQVR